MHEIDSAYGEGVGQLLRTSVAWPRLPAAQCISEIFVPDVQIPVLCHNIRPRSAVESLCGAEVDGLKLHSREIWFRPGPLRGGQFDFPIGTAGSITLVLQAVLPVAVMCPQGTSLHITGGTDVRAVPTLDYFRHVLLAWRRGVIVEVQPSSSLQPLVLDTPEALVGIQVFAHVANLPDHISQRMVNSALAELAPFSTPVVEFELLGRNKAIGPGGTVVLVGQAEHTRLGASVVAQGACARKSLEPPRDGSCGRKSYLARRSMCTPRIRC